jgi:hypothetical protein
MKPYKSGGKAKERSMNFSSLGVRRELGDGAIDAAS